MNNIKEKDHKYIWHPFTRQKDRPDPIPVIRGRGSLLFDDQERKYIDAISSWWVTIHGHAHPYIAEKLYQQALTLEQVIFAGFTHPPAVQLAERLIPLLPGQFDKIFYSDNGSTSTEVALKMAIQYWWNQHKDTPVQPRKKILAFRNSYHGDTFGAMSVSDRSIFTLAFHDFLLDVVFIDTPDAENITELESIILETGNEIAAFIYEPLVQGAGGMIMYEAAPMNRLLKSCREKGILCIADEVMTGFGRTGRMFASSHLDHQPDIICLSKGLTGGTMALGVTACTQTIYEAFVQDDALKTFFHGHSFTANPLACITALASLDLFEQNDTLKLIEAITTQNRLFLTELKKHAETGLIRNIRQTGTILAFDLNTKVPDGYLNPIGQFFTEEAMKRGVYIRPLGNAVYIMPPYCVTREEMEKVYAVITSLLELLSQTSEC